MENSDIGSRIKELRKSLNLTQDDFSKKIGLARNSIANYEIGRREPTNSISLSICREFKVNYLWLTEGIGEMFLDIPETLIDQIAVQYELDAFEKGILKKYLLLDKKKREVLCEFLLSLLD